MNAIVLYGAGDSRVALAARAARDVAIEKAAEAATAAAAAEGVVALKVNKAGDTMTGPLVLPSADPEAANEAARKGYVDAGLAEKAPLASPALTGTPTAPTPALGTNTEQVQTAAGTLSEIEAGATRMTVMAAGTGAVARTVQDKARDECSTLDYIPTAMHAAIQAGTATQDCAPFIADALAAHADVRLVAGRYPMMSSLSIPSGRNLYAHGPSAILDFSGSAFSAASALIESIGTLGASVTITADAVKATDTITAPGHGLAVGDWFRAISTIDGNSLAAGEDRLGDRADVVVLTETHQVFAVPDAATVQIRGFFRFNYPTGSVVRKINPVSNIRMSGFQLRCGGAANRPILVTLGENALLDRLVIDRPGNAVTLRGCFGGSRMQSCHVTADPATAIATNRILVHVLDGCVGATIADCHAANGGQIIDVTYTVSQIGALAAPNLDTKIVNCVVRNAGLSAITDHAGSDGTVITGCRGLSVRGFAFIRSRNGKVTNNKAWGKNDAATSVGVYAGEDGYWGGLTVTDNDMHMFDRGYLLAGTGTSLPKRETLLANNSSDQCRVGEEYGNYTGDDCGIRSVNSRHDRVIETAIRINGSNAGIEIEGFHVRGPMSNAAVEILGSLADARITGSVVALGADIPAIKVASGTPVNLHLEINRKGTCGFNSGVTPGMLRTRERVLGQATAPAALTGSTDATNMITAIARIPSASFNAGARVRVRVWGLLTGTAGSKTLRLRWGSLLLASAALTNSVTPSTFVLEFLMIGTGDATQRLFSTYEGDGLTTDVAGPTARTITTLPGAALNIEGQNASAADTLEIFYAEATGAWA